MTRRLLLSLLLAALAAFTPCAFAQIAPAPVQSICTQGATKAITSGLPSTNTQVSAFPGCTVTVYPHGSATPATIYSTSTSTPLANPFTADTTTGLFTFYATAGVYDVVMTKAATLTTPGMIPTTVTVTAALLGSFAQTQPSTDQYSSNILYVAAKGDVGSRITAYFNAAVAAGQPLAVHLVGPDLAPATANSVIAPVVNGLEYSVTCDNGGGLRYNGTGAAIQEGRANDSAPYTQNFVDGCRIYSDYSIAKAGVSTCVPGMSAGGLSVRNLSLGSLEGTTIPTSTTYAPLDLCGNMVTGEARNITAIFGQDNVRLRGSIPGTTGYNSDANAWQLYNIKTLNAQRWGIAVLGRPQALGIYGHVSEGDGCGTNSVQDPKNASLYVEGTQGLTYDNFYAESACGHQRLLLGNSASPSNILSDFKLGSGIMQDFPGQVDVEVVNADGAYFGSFVASGNADAQIEFLPTVTGHGNTAINANVKIQPGAVPPLFQSDFFKTCSNVGGGIMSCDTSYAAFPAGTCTVYQPDMQNGYWRSVFMGEMNASGSGYYPAAGIVFSQSSPTVTIPTTSITITASRNSAGQLCLTPSASIIFRGHYSNVSSNNPPS